MITVVKLLNILIRQHMITAVELNVFSFDSIQMKMFPFVNFWKKIVNKRRNNKM